MAIELVIFDLDGTLIDTSLDLMHALNHALDPLPPFTQRQTMDMVGQGVSNLINKALGPERQHTGAEVLERFLSYYSQHLTVHSRPYEGIDDMLSALSGMRLAVLSNKRTDLCHKLLRELGMNEHFELVLGPDMVPGKKPSPLGVQHILKITGVPPQRAIVVGDSSFDLKAARGASVASVAVTYGFRDRSSLYGADYIIDAPAELLRVLAQLDRRRTERHRVPQVFRQYISLCIAPEGPCSEQVELMDLSEDGLLMVAGAPMQRGTSFRCSLSAEKLIQKSIEFTAIVRHSSPHDGRRYLVGAEIEGTDDVWIKVFRNILRFISERSDTYAQDAR